MSFLRVNVTILLFTLFIIFINNAMAFNRDETDDFPRVVELVGYNNNYYNRKSRMSQDFQNRQQHLQEDGRGGAGGGSGVSFITPPMKKTRADIERVKQNIEEYNKLLKVDTKKLSEQQKDMLERIVERVARLKESLDIEMPTTTMTATAAATAAATTKDEDNAGNYTETVTTLLPTTESVTIVPPTTITTDAIDGSGVAVAPFTTIKRDQGEARSNPNNLSKKNGNGNSNSNNNGGNNVSSNTGNHGGKSKAKLRTNISRRTTSPTKSATKRTSTGIIRPSSLPSGKLITTTLPTVVSGPSAVDAAAVVITSSSISSSPGPLVGGGSGQKIATITTIPPQINQQQQQQQPQDVVHDVLIKQQNYQQQQQDDDIIAEQKTLPSITDHRQQLNVQQRNPLGAAGAIAAGSDLIYDSNVTTSTIIDSLSNHAREDYYNRDSLSESNSNKEKKPTAGTAKPTKYHYYPHNQHIYLLPECAIQQVCNAVYVRLNYTQPLCACPSRYRDPCSASLNEDDQHTTKLVGDGKKKAITLAKTCEATTEMRECRSPKDWSLLALQNTRTGKSHYLVICRCPDHYKLEGPMAHDQPTYASVPGIRVFGMMCVKPGYSVRRPSVQPPKRYQLQKPYYIPNSSNKYGITATKDRPSSSSSSSSSLSNSNINSNYQQESYQNQHQANYQYLSRPESSPIMSSAHTEFPDSISINSFGGGIYSRNNEKKGDNQPIAASEEGSEDNTEDSNKPPQQDRKKRSINGNDLDLDEDDIPEFPLHRLQEFQQTIIWD